MHCRDAMDWATTLQRLAPVMGAIAIVAGGAAVGALFSVSWVAGRARWMADGPEIGRLAVALFYRRALPLVLVCLAAGAGWSFASGTVYLHSPRLFGLAGAAGLALVLLVAVGGRARRAAASV